MESSAPYIVSLQRAAPRTMAAVYARLAPSAVPLEFKRHLDQVYAARSSGLQLDGQNIFVYREALGQPGQLDIEFGVGVAGPFPPVGAVRPVELPTGEVATTTHLGSYSKLGAAHAAVRDWCRAQSLALAGPSWEIYGHWIGGQPPRTDIFYLLHPVPRAS